jgi:hypothetical protein
MNGERTIGSAEQPCPPTPELNMHLDADRDGVVDDDISGLNNWEWGAGRKGAVVLCNNDDDNSNRRIDNQNDVVDGSDDESDLAPLELRRSPPDLDFPSGWTAILRVSDRSKIRIFKQEGSSWQRVIGPGRGDAFTINDLSPQEFIFRMEGIHYPGHLPDRSFDGLVTLTLEVKNDTGATHSNQEGKVRVAPWLMPNHLDETEDVYVVQTRDNADFRAELAGAVTSGTSVSALTEALRNPYGGDRWMQDVMELGFSSLPKQGDRTQWHLHVVMPTAKNRGGGRLDRYPWRQLVGPNYGYTEPKSPGAADSLDSFGNLECSPPVTVNGIEYKFGRIIYGHDSGRPMHRTVRKFLRAQKVQAPFPVDTSWLAVGHVDEIFSFCPWAGVPKGFKLLLASPATAMQILQDLRTAGQDSAPLLVGINPRLGYRYRTVAAVLDRSGFVRNNERVQRRIDRVEQELRAQLGLEDDDIVKLPVLFMQHTYRVPHCPGTTTYDASTDRWLCSVAWEYPWRTDPQYHLAYTPDVVNMLVVTTAGGTAKLCIPKPFGPVVSSQCQFERYITDQLTASGNTIVFIDCFTTYHHLMGEIHCGTNSKRKPPTDRWWWEQDGIS